MDDSEFIALLSVGYNFVVIKLPTYLFPYLRGRLGKQLTFLPIKNLASDEFS